MAPSLFPRSGASNEPRAVHYPDGYARHEPHATAILNELTGTTGTPTACPTSGVVVGGYALPLDRQWVPVPAPAHHDYPAIDFEVPPGNPVYAVTGGIVTHVDGGYGLGVQITAPDGTTWIYGHNSQQLAAPGTTVQAGDRIALTGNTGHSTGPHLHLEIRTPDGAKRCPQAITDAIALGAPVPAVGDLPTSGCSY